MCLSGVTCLHVDSCKSKDWLRIRIMCLSGVTCLHVDSCKSKDWLRIRIMCLSGVTCLHVDSCKCKRLAQNHNNVSEWSYMSTFGQF